MTASKISEGQTGQVVNEKHYNSLNCNLEQYILLNLKCLRNGLPWRSLRSPTPRAQTPSAYSEEDDDPFPPPCPSPVTYGPKITLGTSMCRL